MYRFFLFSLIAFTQVSCFTEGRAPEQWRPVITDTLAKNFVVYDVHSFGTAQHPILYIGKKKDTIWVDHLFYHNSIPWDIPELDIQREPSENKKYFIDPFTNSGYEFDDHPIFRIYIDTTCFIGYKYFEKDTFYKANAVLIENLSGTYVRIGVNNEVDLITEAKDEHGEWHVIEEKMAQMCGNGLLSIALPPDEMALSAIPIYKGAFKTKLRLKMGRFYSNEIDGFINLNQFVIVK